MDGIEPAPDKPLSVFISYSRDDVDFADQLHATLIIGGYDATIDRHGIHVGEDWERRLGDMVRSADTVVFLLSPSSARSAACAWEVDQAVHLGKRIIPIACRPLDGAPPPPALAALNYIYLYREPRKPGTGFGPGLLDLRTALNTDLDWLREHTRLLQRASEWQASGQLTIRLLSGRDIEAAKAWAARQPKEAPAPTALHLQFFRASEQEQDRQQNAELQRLQQMADAQAARGAALAQQEKAQQREAEALQREAVQSKRVVRRTLAGLLAALLLAALAGWFGIDAELQRGRAQRVLDQAISNANARVASMAERARDVAQRQGVIAGLAASAPRRAAGAASAAAAQGDLARVAGLIELSARFLAEEDGAAALTAAEAGMALADANAGPGQADSQWQMARSRLHQRLGLAAARQGRSERAARDLQTSLALAEALPAGRAEGQAAIAPAAAEVRQRLSSALQDSGDMAVESAQFDQAEQQFARLIRLRTEDLAEAGAGATAAAARRLLATALNRMANLFLAQDKHDGVIDFSNQAITALQQPGTQQAGDPALRRELSTAYQLMADALKAAGKPADALVWIDKDLAITQSLAASDPANAVWQHDLATTHAKRGLLQGDLGRPDAALKSLGQAITLGQALGAQGRKRPEWQRDVAARLELRGTLLAQTGDAKEAVSAFRSALALREQVAATSPGAVWQRELEDAYRRTGAQLLKAGLAAEALETVEQQLFATSLALDSLDSPYDTAGQGGQPGQQAKNTRVARALGELCWTALFARNVPRALWAGEQALALDPGLRFARLNHAHALMVSGDAARARKIYLGGLLGDAALAARWRQSIRADFAELAARKLQHPLMVDINREIGQ